MLSSRVLRRLPLVGHWLSARDEGIEHPFRFAFWYVVTYRYLPYRLYAMEGDGLRKSWRWRKRTLWTSQHITPF